MTNQTNNLLKLKIAFIGLLLLFFINNAEAQSINTPTSNSISPTISPETLPTDYLTTSLNGKKNYQRSFLVKYPETDESQIGINSSIGLVNIRTEYYDGLGRPLQNIVKKGGTNSKDLVISKTYDEVGRIGKQYLPYASSTSNGKFKYSAFSEQNAFYNTNYFPSIGNYSSDQFRYSKIQSDNSLMPRNITNLTPGNAWAGSNRGVRSNQLTNQSGEIKIWEIVSNFPVTTAEYDDNELFVTQNRDEDGSETWEYKDKEGKLIMTKQSERLQTYPVTQLHFVTTYNVYDDFNRLRFVLPPLAIKKLSEIGGLNWIVSQTLLDELCFQYKYDERGRLIEKKVPGKGWEYIVYDKRDRIVLTQDAKLALEGKWNFNIYDQLSRLKVNGIIANIYSDRTTLQNTINTATSTNTNSLTYWLTKYDESNYTYPTSITNADFHSVIYYDYYPVFVTNTFNTQFTMPAGLPNAEPVVASNMTHGQVTYAKTRILKPASSTLPDWIETVNYYDNKARLIQSQLTNHVGGIDISTMQYDFTNKVLATYSHHTNPSTITPLASIATYNTTDIVRKFEFDNQQRLVNSYCTINGGVQMPIVNNQYDALGRLSRKNLGGSTESQTYTYNLRGMLTGINPDWVKTPTPSWTNYFGEILCYDQGFTKPRYNGNIAGVIWRGASPSAGQRSYGYEYDLANRLTHAEFAENSVTQSNTFTPTWQKNVNDFTTSGITYDANGNIMTMNQQGPGLTGTPVTMDKMSYTYKTIGGIPTNQLAKVSDLNNLTNNGANHDFKDGANTGDDYQYDINGNLNLDANKEMTMTYTYQNKPDLITLNNNNTIQYIYDAAGTKLQKITNDVVANKTVITDYVNGHIYNTTTENANTTAKLEYILHEEGRIRPILNGQNIDDYTYDFFVKDHLGNVRATVNAVLTVGEPMVTATERIRDYIATMEEGRHVIESELFDNMDEVLAARAGATATNQRAIVLDGRDPERRIGTSLLLKVMPGDQFSIKSHSYYNTATMNDPIDPSELVNSLINSMTQSNPGNTGEMANEAIISESLNNPDFLSAFTNLTNANNDASKPQAYVNYLFFDERFNFVEKESGMMQVTSPNTWEELYTGAQPKQIREAGYMFVFHSMASMSKIYFDDFDFTYYKGDLLDETHYYPFGLTIDALSNQALGTEQKYKYNGKELQRDEFTASSGSKSGLEWYDYGARMQDPQTGRWGGVDAWSEKYYSWSPYNYTFNNPIKFIDPDGNGVFIYDKRDRKAFLDGLKVRALGTFGIRDNGELYLVKKDGKIGSEYYRDRLIEAINDPESIEINNEGANGTVRHPESQEEISLKRLGEGTTRQTYEDEKEGQEPDVQKKAIVYYSGESYSKEKNKDGGVLKQSGDDIVMHELIGHAIPWITKPDTGNAVDNENKVRQQLQIPLRMEDPTHYEIQ